MNGLILVKDIQVRKNRLKLDGTRVMLVLGNTSNDQLTPLITGKSMHVIVEDITEATIQQQIYEILSRIFTTDKVEDRFTNYWKPLIDKLDKGMNQDLDLAALMALSQWTFEPALKDGVPISVLINVEFRFSLY
jgi:Gram-negative bacterial TonB protein C-terminal